MGFQVALNIGFSMAFVSAYYIIFCVQERVCKSKHLQFVSGVNVLIFWIASFICDLFTFICTSVWILITFLLLRLESYSSNTELSTLFKKIYLHYLFFRSLYFYSFAVFWICYDSANLFSFLFIRSAIYGLYKTYSFQYIHRFSIISLFYIV